MAAHSMPPRAPATNISGQNPEALVAPEGQRHAGSEDGAYGQLAFRPDVPDIGAEADGEAGGDQDQRSALHRQLGEAELGFERGDEEDRRASIRD